MINKNWITFGARSSEQWTTILLRKPEASNSSHNGKMKFITRRRKRILMTDVLASTQSRPCDERTKIHNKLYLSDKGKCARRDVKPNFEQTKSQFGWSNFIWRTTEENIFSAVAVLYDAVKMNKVEMKKPNKMKKSESEFNGRVDRSDKPTSSTEAKISQRETELWKRTKDWTTTSNQAIHRLLMVKFLRAHTHTQIRKKNKRAKSVRHRTSGRRKLEQH